MLRSYQTKILYLVLFLFSSANLLNCNLKVNETQDIEINHYFQKDKDAELVKEIIYYVPSYLSAKIPSFTRATSEGIKLGYFIRQSDGQAAFRVTYDLQNPSVVTHLKALKSEFADYIPKLAAFHASKQPIFIKLQPVGKTWILTLFSESALNLYLNGSKLLKKHVEQTKFESLAKQLKEKYGRPVSIEFKRAQYYEAFDNVPESVSLFYETRFSADQASLTRVSLYKENGTWVVMGFNL